MNEEDRSAKGKWTSHKKNWAIDKTFKGTGVHLNIKNKNLFMNPKNSWVRFETENIIHIYTFEPIVDRKQLEGIYYDFIAGGRDEKIKRELQRLLEV